MLAIFYLLVTISLFIYSFNNQNRLLQRLSYSAFLICFLAIVPLPGKDRTVFGSPTQVVFRFDKYRTLQLTGSRCQGRLYYIDEQKQIYSELALHSARVITEPFSHMAEDYIFIPDEQYSSIDYSRDGGRTFTTTHIEIEYNANYYRPEPETIEKIMVVNNQMFLLDKNKGIYHSPKPFGTSIGYDLLAKYNLALFEGYARYMGARWDNPPQAMPSMPASYQGWDSWQCDLNLKQEMIIHNRYTPFHHLQKRLRSLMGLSFNEAEHDV